MTAGCYACHKKDPATGTRRFNGLPRACADCHKDVHGGQFGPKRDASCDSCHSPEHSWAAVAFDHNRQTQFRLVQAHSRAACDACHKMDAATGVRRYAGTPTRCSGCHKDIHFAQFRVAGQTACESCHASQQAWRDLAFDHNRQSRFKLDAAHGKLACRQCHPEVTLANGVRIIQYKPLKMECRDCHDFER